MPSRKTIALLAAMVCAGPSAIAQNLLDRSIAPPRYDEPSQEWTPAPAPPPPKARIVRPVSRPARPPALPPTQIAKPIGTPAAPSGAGGPAPPYEPQLLRLSELLGALTYLQDLCSGQGGQVWRDKMSALMNAETQDETRRERFAGAYNRGLHGYELSYRECTPNAQAIITRFLDESGKIARDVTHRYGTS